MSLNENNNMQHKRETKKAEFINSNKKRMRLSKPAMVIGGILIIASGILLVFNRTNKPEAPSAAEVQTGNNHEFSYPVGLFEDRKAKFFKYTQGNLMINYFILKSSDGIIRAAFDACDVCWRAGKGYYQDGDEMVCGNCGRHFASMRINEVQGGCNPAPLKRRIEGNNIIIAAGDIIEGAQYFDLSAGRQP
jgi:uncharacterized membrane protein